MSPVFTLNLNFLQPGMEMSRGKLESWPVHPVAESTSNLSLGQAHRPKSVTHHGKRKPASRADAEQTIVPKPKFLEQLEGYLQRELQTLSCPLQGPDLLRLQVIVSAFTQFDNEVNCWFVFGGLSRSV